jgi:hypothetical protein
MSAIPRRERRKQIAQPFVRIQRLGQ